MSTTYAKPYLGALALNLFPFTAKDQGYDQNGASLKPVFGKVVPSLAVDLNLYLGARNVGTQSWNFTEKTQAAVTNVHSGLPDYKSIVSEDISDSWAADFNQVIADLLPEYEDTSEVAKKSGPVLTTRVNRIEVQMPYDKPSERLIAAVIGLYADAECTQQIINADFAVLFVQDDFIKRVAGTQELTDEQIQQIRTQNNWYSLKDFVSRPTIQQSIGQMATALFSTLKDRVKQYKDIDVATIMSAFAIPVE